MQITTKEEFVNATLTGEVDSLSIQDISFHCKIENVVFKHCVFNNVDFDSCRLNNVSFDSCDFDSCKLNYAKFYGCSFIKCQMLDTSCIESEFFGCNMGITCATSAFDNAILDDCNTDNFRWNHECCALTMRCPEEGSYIAWKKCLIFDEHLRPSSVIVKLLIHENALRSSATSCKCRASSAEVLEITDIDGIEHYDHACSMYDSSFNYEVGEMVIVHNFDTNRWNECSTGIHHFMSRKEAVDY